MTSAALLAGGCEPEPPHDEWMFEYAAPTTEVSAGEGHSPVDLSTARVVPLTASGRLGGVSLLGEDVAAVRALDTCEAILLDLSTPLDDELDEMRRIGGCGDGPEEFRVLADLFLDRDTIVALDERQRFLTFLPWEGGPSRRLSLDLPPETPRLISRILDVDEDRILLGSALLPLRSASASEGFLITVDRVTGEILHHFVSDPPAARRNPAMVPRSVHACVDLGSQRLVMVNSWRPERVILDLGSGEPVRRLTTPLGWISEQPREDQEGFATTALVQVACGGGQALVSWRSRDEPVEYYIEVITTEGKVRFQESGTDPDPGHPVLLEAVGRHGDEWVFFSAMGFGEPALVFIEMP